MRLITGVPGAGKTELAVEMAKENQGATLYLSFSTENTKNSILRFGTHATCLSIHALANRLLQINQQRICDKWGSLHLKNALIATKSELPAVDHHYFFELLNKFIQLDVPLFRARSLLSLPEFRLLNESKKAYLLSALLKIWDWIWLTGQQVTHDMYLKRASEQPVHLDFSLLIVDESQDLNESMMCFIENIEKNNPNIDVVLMADRCQQIFGYRGVSKKLNKMSPCRELTESHRFGGNVAKLMNEFMSTQSIDYYTQIAISSKRTEVSVTPGWDQLFQEAQCGRKLTVISRLNMSVWLLAKKLTLQGILFAVKGNAMQDVGFLESLWRSYSHGGRSKNSGIEYRRYKDTAFSMNDRNAITACKLIESIPQSESDFFVKLKSCLTTEDKAKVLLTNIHQAKGLQFHDVVIAGDFQPCIEPNTGNAFRIPAEEAHIIYTAITRCRGHLTLQQDWFSYYQKTQKKAPV